MGTWFDELDPRMQRIFKQEIFAVSPTTTFAGKLADIDSYYHMLELTKYKGYNTPKEKLIAWESFVGSNDDA